MTPDIPENAPSRQRPRLPFQKRRPLRRDPDEAFRQVYFDPLHPAKFPPLRIVPPQGAARALHLRAGQRKKLPPRYWRPLTGALSGRAPVPESRLNGWLLVLEARRIPHFFQPGGGRPRLYVPALYENIALSEIRAFEAERPVPIFVPPVRDNIAGVCFFLLLLLFWHGLRWNWFGFSAPSPLFPSVPDGPEGWSAHFGADAWRMRVRHEWWRAASALTLHADDSHLFSNLGFGLLFLVALCRRAGLGLGFVLILASGICGNIVNALLRQEHAISIGFSTSLFGAVGALCALNAADIVRHYRRFAHYGREPGSTAGAGGLVFVFARRIALPLAAGMALLGILGGGGEARTDYTAHIWGFVCGILVTLPVLPLERRVFSLARASQGLAQAALFVSALGVLVGAWLYALF
ncbi:rhomboid family intramembrane serine protease [Desulfovibrio sp. OttesenSCG-928-A18]|nr:rhomboid family intramembrane serine protease [Desulfovibrio sp. OttesenSCG-928-A18]